MLAWPQNVRNFIPEVVNCKHFPGEDAPRPTLQAVAFVVLISNPLFKIL